MQLGQLPAQRDGPLAEPFLEQPEGGDETVRGLEEHEGAGFAGQLVAPPLPVVQPAGGEAEEGEARDRRARGDEGGGDGRGTGDRGDANAGVKRLTHQVEPRIGDQRRPGVRQQRDRIAVEQALHETGRPPALVVVVEAGGRGRDAVVPQQLARPARVLGRDQPHLLEDADRAEGDVLEVSDGRRDEIQRAGHAGTRPGRDYRVMQKRAIL